MELSIEALAALSPEQVRLGLPAWVASHLDAEEYVCDRLRRDLARLVEVASDAEILAMRSTFAAAGEGWKFFRADPLARRITRVYMSALMEPRELRGVERLLSFDERGGRRMIVCNHLSYTDTQITDGVLARAGLSSIADRLVAVAGPKVYTETWRRMASIALNTRKTAQSSAVASEQDSMTARELAVVAIETLAECGRLMDQGYIVLLYPEGTRSRDAKLQPFLRAAARYLQIEGVNVLPLAQTGGDKLFPIDAPRMFRGPVRVAFGQPFRPSDIGGKTGALEEAHKRLQAELPEAYRNTGPRVA